MQLQAKHLLNLFASAYPGLVTYIDKDYCYQYANENYKDWFGVLPEPGQKVEEVVGKENFARRKVYLDECLAKKTKVKFKLALEQDGLPERILEQIYEPDISEDGTVRGVLALASDVTDQENAKKKAKNIAEEERLRFHSLLMQAPVGIGVTVGPEHTYELVNPKGEEYAGRKLLGLTLKEAVPEHELQGFFKLFDDIFQTGSGRSIKAAPISLKENGKVLQRYFDLFYEPIKDQQGSTTGILNISVDVTEQIEALKRAEDSEALFRTYAEGMPQMFFVTNAAGAPIYINKRWKEYTGLDFQEVHEWKSEILIHPEDYPTTMEEWARSLATHEPLQLEHRILHNSGIYRWNLARAIPIKNAKGKVIQWIGTNTDIHDQKEISSHQTRLLQVLDSSSDFIGMADKEERGIYINKAGRRMLGIEEDRSASSICIQDFFFPEDLSFARDTILKQTRELGHWVGDIRFRHFTTGEEVWLNYNAFITRDEKTGEITGYATVSRDVTEMKQRERDLEEALKTRDQFLSIASHELKTPLTSLKLQAQLILRTLASGKNLAHEKQLFAANQTDQLVGRLTRLIDDMLDVSRIRTGKLKLDLAEHELGDIVRESAFRMNVLFEEAGLKLPSIEASEKIYGHWDRFRLEQVLGNLLTNAIRYGKQKPIKIKITKEGGRAVLSVTDFGMGISKEDQKRIFERFERAINSSEVSGLGLGLFISKEIVEAHHGSIWAESEPDKGSTFYVSLPLTE